MAGLMKRRKIAEFTVSTAELGKWFTTTCRHGNNHMVRV